MNTPCLSIGTVFAFRNFLATSSQQLLLEVILFSISAVIHFPHLIARHCFAPSITCLPEKSNRPRNQLGRYPVIRLHGSYGELLTDGAPCSRYRIPSRRCLRAIGKPPLERLYTVDFWYAHV